MHQQYITSINPEDDSIDASKDYGLGLPNDGTRDSRTSYHKVNKYRKQPSFNRLDEQLAMISGDAKLSVHGGQPKLSLPHNSMPTQVGGGQGGEGGQDDGEDAGS